MPHLSVFEKYPRLFAARPREFEDGGGAAHALELNDVGNVEVAQRPLKFFAFLFAHVEERADEIDEIAVREWFFEEVNRTQTGGLLALGSEMDRRQDDGARPGMAGAQIVEKLLPEIVGRVDIEDEKVGTQLNDDALGFLQIARDFHLRAGSRFAQGRLDGGGEVFIGRED